MIAAEAFGAPGGSGTEVPRGLKPTLQKIARKLCPTTMNEGMRVWNRAKLLWSYLARRTTIPALPVEYIVETTAKCNLYCPMCPRETHKQPKEDMPAEIFERLRAGWEAQVGSARMRGMEEALRHLDRGHPLQVDAAAWLGS